MTDLEKLKLNLQESQAPYFSDAELTQLLEVHTDVWLASYYGCVMKAQANDQIEVNGIKIPNNSEYWFKLADVYKSKASSVGVVSGYKTSMSRADGR